MIMNLTDGMQCSLFPHKRNTAWWESYQDSKNGIAQSSQRQAPAEEQRVDPLPARLTQSYANRPRTEADTQDQEDDTLVEGPAASQRGENLSEKPSVSQSESQALGSERPGISWHLERIGLHIN